MKNGWLGFILNNEDISTKADSHICQTHSTCSNQDICSEIFLPVFRALVSYSCILMSSQLHKITPVTQDGSGH